MAFDKVEHKAQILDAWKNLLDTDKQKAAEAIRMAVRRMHEAKLFHSTEIAQFVSQMKNGSACPGDFADGRYGRITRA